MGQRREHHLSVPLQLEAQLTQLSQLSLWAAPEAPAVSLPFDSSLPPALRPGPSPFFPSHLIPSLCFTLINSLVCSLYMRLYGAEAAQNLSPGTRRPLLPFSSVLCYVQRERKKGTSSCKSPCPAACLVPLWEAVRSSLKIDDQEGNKVKQCKHCLSEPFIGKETNYKTKRITLLKRARELRARRRKMGGRERERERVETEGKRGRPHRSSGSAVDVHEVGAVHAACLWTAPSATGERTQGEGHLGRRAGSPGRVTARMGAGQARRQAGWLRQGCRDKAGRVLLRDTEK